MNEKEKALSQLKRHEGFRKKPYRDTVGKWTIGIGRNLDDVGISISEAMHLLENDVERVRVDLHARIPWIKELNEPRYWALVNMGFNLGVSGLMSFKNMLKAIENEQWEQAHNEALNSKWANQVGNRAYQLAKQIRTGEWPDSV